MLDQVAHPLRRGTYIIRCYIIYNIIQYNTIMHGSRCWTKSPIPYGEAAILSELSAPLRAAVLRRIGELTRARAHTHTHTHNSSTLVERSTHVFVKRRALHICLSKYTHYLNTRARTHTRTHTLRTRRALGCAVAWGPASAPRICACL